MRSVILLPLTLAGHQDYNPVCRWLSPARVAPACGVYFESSTMGCVYRAKNKVNGKCYVGQTTKTMRERRKGHERRTQEQSLAPFHCAIRKYGFDAFEWKVLMRSSDPDDLKESEIVMIRQLKSKAPNGYNLTDGGEGTVGIVHSEEYKKRHSRIMKEVLASPEIRAKIGASHKNRPKSEEQKKKTSISLMGHFVSLETRKKQSVSHTGRSRGPLSVEHRMKLRVIALARKKREATDE